jgi:hypothetical protein
MPQLVGLAALLVEVAVPAVLALLALGVTVVLAVLERYGALQVILGPEVEVAVVGAHPLPVVVVLVAAVPVH